MQSTRFVSMVALGSLLSLHAAAGLTLSILTVDLTLHATKPVNATPVAVVASSSAINCRIALSAWDDPEDDDEPDVDCDTDGQFSGGAYAGPGTTLMVVCGNDTPDNLPCYSSMDGSLGTYPAFDELLSMGSVNGYAFDGDYTPIPCWDVLMSVPDGSIVFSSFPDGVSLVPECDVGLYTVLGGNANFSPRSVSPNSYRSRIAIAIGGSSSTVTGVIQRIGEQVIPPASWTEVSNTIDTIASDYIIGNVVFHAPTLFPTPNGSGGYSLQVKIVQADENQLDLNGDGRFDDNDVTWLESEIPSSDPILLARANLNVAGSSKKMIDQGDVDALILLLGQDLGTPKFGDRDGDGCVTCADAIHGEVDVDDQFDDVTPDNPLYNISLDANADGVIDTSDRLAFYALVNHGDLNGDTIVDDDDMVLFGGYYNTLTTAEGDQDGDGDTDDDDFIIFSVRYNELVCPTCS